NIIVAAVLETHMDKKAVATINPNTIRCGVTPMTEIIAKAIRWWRFHFSIAIAIKNPPRNKKMISFPYDDTTVSPSKVPVIGSRIIGRSDVTGMGIGPVIHHVAIHQVEARPALASKLIPSG